VVANLTYDAAIQTSMSNGPATRRSRILLEPPQLQALDTPIEKDSSIQGRERKPLQEKARRSACVPRLTFNVDTVKVGLSYATPPRDLSKVIVAAITPKKWAAMITFHSTKRRTSRL